MDINFEIIDMKIYRDTGIILIQYGRRKTSHVFICGGKKLPVSPCGGNEELKHMCSVENHEIETEGLDDSSDAKIHPMLHTAKSLTLKENRVYILTGKVLMQNLIL